MVQISSVDFLILLTLTRSSSALVLANRGGGSQTCYYPSGATSNGTAVERSQTGSTCCAPGFVGLNNGLCTPKPDSQRHYSYSVYRPTCTDSTWNSGVCPKVCVGSGDNLSGDQGIIACGGYESYCCARSYDCCSDPTNIFHLRSTTIATAPPTSVTGQALSIDPIAAASSTTASSSESSSSSSSSSSSADPSSHPHKFPILGVVLGSVIGTFVLLSGLAAFLLLRRTSTPRQSSQQPSAQSRPFQPKSILKSRSNRPTFELPNARLVPGLHDRRSAYPGQPLRYQLVIDERSPTNPDGSPASARTPHAGWPGHAMTPIEVASDTRRATMQLAEMVQQAS